MKMRATTCFFVLGLAALAACSKSKSGAPATRAWDAGAADAWMEPAIPSLVDECPAGTQRKEQELDDGEKEDWCERPDGQRHGPYRIFYASGAKKLHARFVDGKLEGPSVGMYESGAKGQHTLYKNGLREGPETLWYESGAIWLTGHYRNGKKEGLVTNYSYDGTKQEEIPYLHGERHGIAKQWDSSGRLTNRTKYDHGKVVWEIEEDAGADGQPPDRRQP
jgi:hypothetical protein